MYAEIKAIEYYLPKKILGNKELSLKFPEWTESKIKSKTGIEQRHIASNDECASDLAYHAALNLFESGHCTPKDIDYILLCTQSPDYFLPTTACILQDRLDIPKSAGCLDYNLGCSGYIYGLSLAKGLIETQQASNVLLITAETYSKYIDINDVATRTIFGDAAAASLISTADINDSLSIGPFVFGTDGSGANNLIVHNGGMRNPAPEEKILKMNGPDIFSFTIKSVPNALNKLLEKSSLLLTDIDYFIFHQANEFMLNHLRDKINIPESKFYVNLSQTGNTVSSTIPIALKEARKSNMINQGERIALVGFGVGYSWGACIIKLN